jgi:hypothetical protein
MSDEQPTRTMVMLTADLARRSLELANSRGLSRSALVRQLLTEVLDRDAESVHDDGSPGQPMTIEEWRAALPGPLRTRLRASQCAITN